MVQGISIDPTLKYIITMSADSTVRGYKNRKLKTQLQFFHKFVSHTTIDSFNELQTLKNREEEIYDEQGAMIDTGRDIEMTSDPVPTAVQQPSDE